jgi:hypothetical protein
MKSCTNSIALSHLSSLKPNLFPSVCEGGGAGSSDSYQLFKLVAITTSSANPEYSLSDKLTSFLVQLNRSQQ